MSKHRDADQKLVSRNMRKQHMKPNMPTPSDNSAPQIGSPKTNSKNSYR